MSKTKTLLQIIDFITINSSSWEFIDRSTNSKWWLVKQSVPVIFLWLNERVKTTLSTFGVLINSINSILSYFVYFRNKFRFIRTRKKLTNTPILNYWNWKKKRKTNNWSTIIKLSETVSLICCQDNPIPKFGVCVYI